MRTVLTFVVVSAIGSASSCSDRTTFDTSLSSSLQKPAAPTEIDSDRVPLAGLPSIGSARPLVSVVAFVDYECPFSQRADKTFAELRGKYGDDLRVSFANRPLPMHPHARDAALAAIAADEQGRFPQMHAALFASKSLDDEGLVAAATTAGLDLPRWEAARHGAKVHDALSRSEELAQRLDVKGTPTSYVDGQRIEGAQPEPTFVKAIDDDRMRANALLHDGVPRSGLYARMVRDAKAPPVEVEAPCHADDAPSRADDEIKSVPIGDAPLRGIDTAKVSVVVYTDLECPFCARLDGRLRELVALYPDKVKVAYKAHPLPMHRNARLAARAGVAAHAQGKYLALSDAMFAHQTALDRASIEAYAEEAGLDMARFRRDLDDPKANDKVTADTKEGDALGVSGTPTFFVNGRKLVGARTMTELVAAVERAIAER